MNVIRRSDAFFPKFFEETNYVEMYAIPIDNNLAADNGITKNVMENLCNALMQLQQRNN